MTRRARLSDDQGFTLVESVIAMLIMTIAVVTVVGALSTMITLTGEHRGHAVVETGARSFAQAVQEQGQFRTTLAVGVDDKATDKTLALADASLFPEPTGSQVYVSVGREVMLAEKLVGSSLQVVRAQGGSTLASHGAGTAVVPFFRCATAPVLTPRAGAYAATAAVEGSSIMQVTHWRPKLVTTATGTQVTGDFVDAAGCAQDFDAQCKGGRVSPECGTGLMRISVTSTTKNDERLDSAQEGSTSFSRSPVTTTTTVLVRRASA